MSLILCLHRPATFYPGSHRFHANAGSVGLYVATPLLCIKTYEEDNFFLHIRRDKAQRRSSERKIMVVIIFSFIIHYIEVL